MENSKGTVYFGSDHEGYELKKDMEIFLKEKGYDLVELGVFKEDDMPFDSLADEVHDKVEEHENALGVLLFGKKVKVEEKTEGNNQKQK